MDEHEAAGIDYKLEELERGHRPFVFAEVDHDKPETCVLQAVRRLREVAPTDIDTWYVADTFKPLRFRGIAETRIGDEFDRTFGKETLEDAEK